MASPQNGKAPPESPKVTVIEVEVDPSLLGQTVELNLTPYRVNLHVDPPPLRGAIELSHPTQVDQFVELSTVDVVILAVLILNMECHGASPYPSHPAQAIIVPRRSALDGAFRRYPSWLDLLSTIVAQDVRPIHRYSRESGIPVVEIPCTPDTRGAGTAGQRGDGVYEKKFKKRVDSAGDRVYIELKGEMGA